MRSMPILYLATLLGPSLAGILMTALADGKQGFQSMVDRMFKRKVGMHMVYRRPRQHPYSDHNHPAYALKQLSEFFTRVGSGREQNQSVVDRRCYGTGSWVLRGIGMDRIRYSKTQAAFQPPGHRDHHRAGLGRLAFSTFCRKRQRFRRHPAGDLHQRNAVLVPTGLQSADGMGL